MALNLEYITVFWEVETLGGIVRYGEHAEEEGQAGCIVVPIIRNPLL